MGTTNNKIMLNGKEFRIYTAQDTHMPSPFMQYWISNHIVDKKEFTQQLRNEIYPVKNALDALFY